MAKTPSDVAGFNTREKEELVGELDAYPSDSGDSSDSGDIHLSDSERTISENFVISSAGHHDQQEIDSGWVAPPVGESDASFDSERTISASFGLPTVGDGDYSEADSGHRKSGDQDENSHAKEEKLLVHNPSGHGYYLDADSGRSKAPNQVVSSCAEMNNLNVGPLPRAIDRKEFLPLPKWLKDIIPEIEWESWQHFQVPRMDNGGAKDKYYTHRDYAYTFRSKPEVTHFLETGEVKGKRLEKKISADSGQGCGSKSFNKKKEDCAANCKSKSFNKKKEDCAENCKSKSSSNKDDTTRCKRAYSSYATRATAGIPL
ncbi:hypothetical protein ACP70R_043141 [Stipagrostis hirtigluma subsp. patula]